MSEHATLVLDKHFDIRDIEDAVMLNESATLFGFNWTLYYSNALQVVPSLEDASVQCVITDPPYWTMEKHRNVGTTTRLGGHRNKAEQDDSMWFKVIGEDDLRELVDEFSRILPKRGHAWVMTDGQTLAYLLGYASQGHLSQGGCHNFDYYKPYPVLKRAQNGGLRMGTGYHGKGSHEYVTLLEKGKTNYFRDRNWPDVFEPLWCGDAESREFTTDREKYPTAKPAGLFRRFVELSTDVGDTVLDPFVGSGTAAEAALSLGRKFIGMDTNPESVITTCRRIQALLGDNESPEQGQPETIRQATSPRGRVVQSALSLFEV